jgi:hypothetical protein
LALSQDDLIERLGGPSAVAEMTGRTRRLERVVDSEDEAADGEEAEDVSAALESADEEEEDGSDTDWKEGDEEEEEEEDGSGSEGGRKRRRQKRGGGGGGGGKRRRGVRRRSGGGPAYRYVPRNAGTGGSLDKASGMMPRAHVSSASRRSGGRARPQAQPS